MSQKFRTAFDKLDIASVTGEGFSVDYTASYDDSGTLVLEPCGKRDIYSEIQSYAESVDINNILLRYSRGDLDVLSKVQGFYEDVSEMPKTYQDVLNSVIKTEQFFDSLPTDKKELFNNSFSEFMVKFADPDFLKYFEQEDSGFVPPDDKDVNEDES